MDNADGETDVNTFVECDKLVALDPVQFIGINLSWGSAFPLHRLQGLGQRLGLLCNT